MEVIVRHEGAAMRENTLWRDNKPLAATSVWALFFAFGALGAIGSAAHAATRIWDGGGTTANWTDAGNWDGDLTAPSPNDDLVFPSLAGQKTNTNNFPANTPFNSLSFTGNSTGYTIGGNAIDLAAGITRSATLTAPDTLNLTIRLTANQTWTIDTPSDANRLILGEHIEQVGTLTLTKQGAGTIELLNRLAGGASGNFNGLSNLSVSGGSFWAYTRPGPVTNNGAFGNNAINANGAGVQLRLLGTPGSKSRGARTEFSNGATLIIDPGLTYETEFTSGSGTNPGTITSPGPTPATLEIGISSGTDSGTSVLLTGNLNLIKSGSNTLSLNRAATYTGTTAIVTRDIKIGVNNALPVGTNLTIGDSNRITSLNLNGLNQTVASLASSFTTGTATVQNNAVGIVSKFTVNGSTSTTYAGTITNGLGTVNLTKAGTSTLTLSGNNSYTGATTLTGGTLAIGAANRIANASNFVFNGGTFATNGNAESVGTLSLQASSTLDMGAGAGVLTFAESGGAAFTSGATLSITNYNGDQLFVGNSASLSSQQLSQIVFVNPNGASGNFPATQLSTGEVVPVTAAVDATGALISEFRLSGPNGTADEYVEIYNNNNAALNISGWKIQYATASNSAQTATVPSGTIVPVRGHYLFAGSQYSLTSSSPNGAADATMTGDALNTSGIQLLNADNLLIDEITLASAPTGNAQYAFVRKVSNGNNPGIPTDTGAPEDFQLVETSGALLAGTSGNVQAALGAPSPENRTSPVQNGVTLTALDPSVSISAAPNRARPTTSGTGLTQFGTLRFRRTIKNETAQTITRVRIHIVTITTLNSPGYSPGGAQADVRLLTSPNELSVPTTANPGGVSVIGTTLEPPSEAANGGGLNSNTVALNQALLPGQTANYSFDLGVVQTGRFVVGFTVEVLPAS